MFSAYYPIYVSTVEPPNKGLIKRDEMYCRHTFGITLVGGDIYHVLEVPLQCNSEFVAIAAPREQHLFTA